MSKNNKELRINRPYLCRVKHYFNLLFFTVFCGFSQETFIFPLTQPPLLTGNYGEIRPNHFHTGIDFKTHPTEHLPIKAVADGYISRIKISDAGYGKALYITHPNGLVSVYAHQFSFNEKIKNYTKAAQEKNETFEIELFPKPDELPVKQGDIIGFTGNTGGSEGPHLHFEIRDEKSEVPLNPLRYLKVEDKVKPEIRSLAFYDEKFALVKTLKAGSKKMDTVEISVPFGLAADFSDRETINGNRNNIYKAEILMDGVLIYRHVLDSISFDVGRYVNTYCDYETKKRKGIRYQKLFKEKNNELPVYKVISNNGFISFADSGFHRIKIIAYDFYNNKSEVQFYVKSKTQRNSFAKKYEQDCLKPYEKQQKDYSIKLPAKSLYHDAVLFDYYKDGKLHFGATDYDIPLQNAAEISIKIPDSLLKFIDKLCIVDVTSSVVEKRIYCGGKAENGFVKTSVKNFGIFVAGMDTVAPEIKLLTVIKEGQAWHKGQTIAFRVTDDFSGIGHFKLYINGKWFLSEYEHKNSSIFFTIDETIPAGKNSLQLTVDDKKNNQAVYALTFNL